MASKDLTRYYKIQPYERGLGFIVIEYIYDSGKIKRLEKSNNHCDESLCEVEIKRRKETVKTVQGLDLTRTAYINFTTGGIRICYERITNSVGKSAGSGISRTN